MFGVKQTLDLQRNKGYHGNDGRAHGRPQGRLHADGAADSALRAPRPRGNGLGPVVVIGDIMVDIAIKPAGDIRVGSDTASEIRLGVGGTGANTSIHLARLGVDVQLFGRVGGDDLGSFVTQRLRDEGVQLPGAPCAGVTTGAIGILVDKSGQRTMFPQQGANEFVDLDFVRQYWPGAGPSGSPGTGSPSISALFVSGYALLRESSREAARWAMAKAEAAGAPIFVDPASYALIEDVGVERFLRWTAGATVLLPNREEASVLARAGMTAPGASDGFPGGGPTSGPFLPEGHLAGETPSGDARKAAVRLAHTFPAVVVTLDGEGALVRSGENEWAVPGLKVPVVDTTGAGDSFNAALIAAYIDGKSIVDAVQAGNRLAASVVQQIGPT